MAIALLMAAIGAIAVGSRLLQPDLAGQRITVIRQVIDAMNQRDLVSLRAGFSADGTMEIPGIDARKGREGDVLVSDGWRPNRDWMGLIEPWGLEAVVGPCRTPSENAITCAVRTRWHVLHLEIAEEWTFDFDTALIRRLQMLRVDPDPPDRVLPLGLADLQEWERWLRETHPEQADRLLPTGPDIFGHWYFRFGLDASPAEIGTSIQEFLDDQ